MLVLPSLPYGRIIKAWFKWVCVIVVSPDGKLETWPDNLNGVKAVLSAVKESRKPIRSENLREKKGDGGDCSMLCSRIKIPKSVKGKEIDVENCGVFGNNGAGVVDEELYDVSGAYQENKNAKQDNNFGIGIPRMSLVDMRYEMGSCSTSAFNSGLNFSNQQRPNLIAYHHQQQYVIGNNSSALNTTGVNNNLVHPNLAYQQYVMGNSSAFNSGVSYPNQEPSSSLAYQNYEIGIWSSSSS
nr:hypothetical protein Itr_chr14CG05810 [Ipomoea trifida]